MLKSAVAYENILIKKKLILLLEDQLF